MSEPNDSLVRQKIYIAAVMQLISETDITRSNLGYFGSFFREGNARIRNVRSYRFAIAIEAEQCFAPTIE